MQNFKIVGVNKPVIPGMALVYTDHEGALTCDKHHLLPDEGPGDWLVRCGEWVTEVTDGRQKRVVKLFLVGDNDSTSTAAFQISEIFGVVTVSGFLADLTQVDDLEFKDGVLYIHARCFGGVPITATLEPAEYNALHKIFYTLFDAGYCN